MPAPTAPELTMTTCLPCARMAATCAANWPICAKSGCLRLSVRTPVPNLTTMRLAFFNVIHDALDEKAKC